VELKLDAKRTVVLLKFKQCNEMFLNMNTRVSDYIKLKITLSKNKYTYAVLHIKIVEKLPIVHILKNFPAFYGTRRLITVFTRSLQWSLS
jgi:hypothetical protein